MIIPQELQLQDWATWENVSIPLSNLGTVVIRGCNKDDLKHPNFVGKSALFNSIYALIYGQHQLASRKNSIKKIIDDSTIIRYTQTIDEHKIVSVLKDSHLRIKIDDEILHTQKKNDERTELQALMMSSEMWTSSVHINGIASNPLLRGSSAMRCNFLEKAFDLDRWTDYYSKVGNVLSQMQRADNELEKINADIIALNYQKIDVEEIKNKLEIEKNKLTKIKKIIAKTNRILGIVSNLPDKVDIPIDELKSEISRLEKLQAQSSAYNVEYKEWESKVEQKRELKDELQSLKKSIYDVAIVKDLDLKIAKLQEQIEQHSNHTESCPVCGHRMKDDIDKDKLNRVRKIMGEVVSEPIDINEIRLELKKLQSIKKQKENNERIEIKLTSVRKQLSKFKDLVKPEGKLFSDQQKKQLDLARKNLQNAEQWEKVAQYESYNVKELEAKLDRLSSLEEKIVDKNSKAESLLSSYEKTREQYLRLRKRQKELETEVELRPIYKALKSAYSPNGMRLWLLQELLEALISGLNENIHSTKDFKTFGYKLSRNRELVLTASNLRKTYDLYMLSGAEGVLFTLNLLTVLLPMLPANKRCSMLILDDMDAMCSSPVRNIIADVYLSRLSKMVDTLFFLTPTTRNEFMIPNSTEWLVTKQNCVSSLKM